MIGISETVIGLTIVAVGTATPELITSIIAAKRGNSDIALGNIVGSNIMNILIILGVTAVITPVPFAVTSYLDLALATLAPIALLIFASIWTRGTVGKKE
jgi:cation:H+ antiporter